MVTTHQVRQEAGLKLGKIAVLTDFSTNADTALRYAVALARGSKASLVLAHAYIPQSSAFSAPTIELTYQALDHWRQSLRNHLLSQAEALGLGDIHCVPWLHDGGPRGLLEDLSDADLIAMGTSGKTGFGKAALGSTAEEIFRSSKIPVLTVGPHCHCSEAGEIVIDTILYATDFSSGAAKALPYALLISKEHNAKLILLHVVNDRKALPSIEQAMGSAEPLEKLRKLIPDGIGLKYAPTFVAGFGKPEDVIVEEAKNRKADMIVIGTQKVAFVSVYPIWEEEQHITLPHTRIAPSLRYARLKTSFAASPGQSISDFHVRQ